MLKKFTISILFLCLTVSLFTGCGINSSDSRYQQAITTARTEIWKSLSSGTASSATVAIMDDDKIIYSEGFGMRDRQKSLAVDTNTQFNIGSVSKVFTATSILLLCEDGKIDLDKPITTYLPDFTMKDERYKNITVRMLLNHSSGFPGSNMKDALGTIKNRNYIDQTIALLKESELKHNPGEISVYCNDGLTVAEAIIEKVSGQSFADFLQERVFSKMGMKNSSCYFKDGNFNIALNYDYKKGTPFPKEYLNVLGSGGISSTAEDLCKFSYALYTNKLFKPETLEEFKKSQVAPNTVPVGKALHQIGLGWDNVSIEKFEQQGITVLSKNGATLQFNSMFYVAPKEKLSVALIFTGSTNTEDINDKIMQALLEGKGLANKIEKPNNHALKTISIPNQLYEYEGFYCSQGHIFKAEIDKNNNTLNLKAFSNGEFAEGNSYSYKEDGGFEVNDSLNLLFAQNYGKKFIVSRGKDSQGSTVYAESIKSGDSKIDGSAFEEKIWLPRNLSLTEFGIMMVKTGLIKQLPGYVYTFSDGCYTPYKLSDEKNTKMCLPYSRDLTEPKLINHDGEILLKLGNYLFTDSANVANLVSNEVITINQDNANECRRIVAEGKFNIQTPSNARVIVFSPQMETTYDSLIEGGKELLLSPDSYVIFMGNAGDAFQPKIK